jgi:hypothetical protein
LRHARCVVAAEQITPEAIEALCERRGLFFFLAVRDTAKHQ